MIDYLLHIDRELFFLINNAWHTPLGDMMMPWFREKLFWVPLYVLLAGFLLHRYKLKGVWVMLLTVLVVILCDQISSSLVKPFFHRLRPCKTPEIMEQVKLLVHCGSGYSFTSSHATNHFGVAVFLGLLLWRVSKLFLLIGLPWAALISIAQVYVGVHYPLDITGGALLGSLIGFLVYLLARRLNVPEPNP